MEKESLHFKIGLSTASIKKKPEFKIGISGSDIIHATLTQNSEFFEFDAEITDGQQVLEITLLNKNQEDTIKDNTGNIIDDMLLSISSIAIDDIDIGLLKWTASSYFPLYPESYLDESQKQITEVKNCVDLGWNGTWKLAFTSPFYIWLLDKI